MTKVCIPKVIILLFLLNITSSENVVRMSLELHETETNSVQNPLNTAYGNQGSKPFAFASYYGDHMVLQRAPQRATIWGYHPDPGSRVILQVKERKVYNAVVNDQGVWTVLLDAETSAGPFTIVALTETQSLQLNDVLFGDVWFCSGQSNMQFTLDRIFNGSEEIKAAQNFTNIRVFAPGQHYSKQPLPDLKSVMLKWSLPSKESLSGNGLYFSAICWLYGKAMYQKLNYPIGLIDSIWGGTPVESWMSTDALKKCGLKPQHEDLFNNIFGTLSPTKVNRVSQEDVISPLTSSQDSGELWNAMIHPFLPLTIYGVIWDQGENDAHPPIYRNRYNCTFPAMIDDWRDKFSMASQGQTRADFPFGFIQIGACWKDFTSTEGFPEIRWHQTADYGYVPNARMKNVFMSVTMDITDFTSPWGPVHTRDKEDIADRLILGGLDVAYNISSFWHGPLPLKGMVSSDTLLLDYGNTWTLQQRHTEGFDLCCSLNKSRTCQTSTGDAVWMPTPIMSSNSTHVQLYAGVCDTESSIVGLRYAWRITPCVNKKCAIYCKENSLPGPPFVAYPDELSSGQEDMAFVFDWSKPVSV